MAYAATDVQQRWRHRSTLSESDDVQRSIELLDKVLSEYSDDYSGMVPELDDMEIDPCDKCETDDGTQEPPVQDAGEASYEGDADVDDEQIDGFSCADLSVSFTLDNNDEHRHVLRFAHANNNKKNSNNAHNDDGDNNHQDVDARNDDNDNDNDNNNDNYDDDNDNDNNNDDDGADADADDDDDGDNDRDADDDDDDDDDDEDRDDDEDDDDNENDEDDNDGDDEEEQLTNYSDIDLPTDSKHLHNVMNFDGRFSRRRKKKRKDGLTDRGVSESESERFSIPRSSSVSIERFSIRANYDSSDFSRANSISNEKFHSDFSLAVASASSGDCVSIPTSDPFSVRNLDFAASAFSLGRADSFSEKFSDIYSTRNSDFSTRNSTDFRTTQSEEEERFSDDSLEEIPHSTASVSAAIPPTSSSSTAATAVVQGITSRTIISPTTTILFSPNCTAATVTQPKMQVYKRHSIAWEVPFEQNALYAPGSTKVVGRRRRRSSDISSIDSTGKLQDLDYDWTEFNYYHHSTGDNDISKSPYSPMMVFSVNSNTNKNNSNHNNNNNNQINDMKSSKHDFPVKHDDTYIIRSRSRKKKHGSKRYSNTFDDIKSLLREGKLQGLNEPPPDFVPPPVPPPDLVRVLSLPSFSKKQGLQSDVVDPNSNANRDDELRDSYELQSDFVQSIEIKNKKVDCHTRDINNHCIPIAAATNDSFTTDTNTTITIINTSAVAASNPPSATTSYSSSSSLPPSSSTAPPLQRDNGKCQKSKHNEYVNVTSSSLPISNSGVDIASSYKNSSSSAYKKSPSGLSKKKFESCGNFAKLDRFMMEHSNQSKIPVNVLIEDQIVKKALNENRRQLEKVSDALKELENVRNIDTLSKNDKDKVRANSRNSTNDVQKNDDVHGLEADVNNLDKFKRDDSGTSPEYKYCSKSNNSINQYLHASGNIKTHENQLESQQAVENVIDTILENSKNSLFQVNEEMMEFPPLPPSPVEEADEENCDTNIAYTNANTSTYNGATHSVNVPTSRHLQSTRVIPEYRPRVPPHRIPLSSITNAKDDRSSVDTDKSMDMTDGHLNNDSRRILNNSRQDYIPNDRCTLPSDQPGPSSRTRSKRRVPPRSSPAADNGMDNNSMIMDKKNMPPGTISGMQTSCSLPETPVFARGCEANSPRVPPHVSNTGGSTLSMSAAATITTTNAALATMPTATATTTKTISTTSETVSQIRRQPSWYGPTISTTGGYRRHNPGLEEAIIGTELLRLAGGPNRGWYPTRRGTANQPRPSSIEHLERLNHAYESRLPGGGHPGDFLQRKPLTLPTNITPNKFFGQQSKHSTATSGTREALRRVTSLLIKKGVGVKGDMKGGGGGGGSGKDGFLHGGNGSGGGPYASCDSATGNDGQKKKGFFKNFWKRSRHYSLENQ